MATSAVVMSEILKFASCMLIIFYQQGTFRRFVAHLHENIFMQPGNKLINYQIDDIVHTDMLYINFLVTSCVWQTYLFKINTK